jgi:hypothetical protein
MFVRVCALNSKTTRPILLKMSQFVQDHLGSGLNEVHQVAVALLF